MDAPPVRLVAAEVHEHDGAEDRGDEDASRDGDEDAVRDDLVHSHERGPGERVQPLRGCVHSALDERKTTPCTRKPTRTQITPHTRGAQKAHVSASAFAIARFEVEFEEGCRTRAAVARGPRVASAIKNRTTLGQPSRLRGTVCDLVCFKGRWDATTSSAPSKFTVTSRNAFQRARSNAFHRHEFEFSKARNREKARRGAAVFAIGGALRGRTTRGAARGAVVGRSARRHGDTLAVRRCGVGQRRRRAPRGGVRPQRARHRQPRRARRVSRAGGVRRRDARGPARHPHLGRRALHHHHDRRARLGVVGPGRHPRAPRLQRRGSVRRRVVLRRRPRRHPRIPSRVLPARAGRRRRRRDGDPRTPHTPRERPPRARRHARLHRRARGSPARARARLARMAFAR